MYGRCTRMVPGWLDMREGICAVRSVEKCEDRLRRAETLCLRYTRDARVRRYRTCGAERVVEAEDGTRAKGASCGASKHAGK